MSLTPSVSPMSKRTAQAPQLAARLAAEKPGAPAYAASRSFEVMAPHTPYGSRTLSACSRQLCMTGQLTHTALAARSRLRRDGPRSPSGWKKTSGLSRRQEPSSCHCHRSATGPGRRETSANGVSFDDPARGRCASPSQVDLSPQVSGMPPALRTLPAGWRVKQGWSVKT